MGSVYRWNIRHLICFIALVMMLFLSCSAFISLSYDYNYQLSSFTNPANSLTDRHETLQPTENQFFFALLSVQQVLQEIRPTQKVASRIRNWRNSLQIVSVITLLSLMSMSLFMHHFMAIIRNKNRYISVITFLIGGHAPPSVLAR